MVTLGQVVTRSAFAAAAAVCFASAASADGMPRGAYYREAPFSWTGLYIGMSAGGIWGTDDLKFNPPTKTVGFDGGAFGGQIGAQYQFSNVVVGVEVSYTDSSDSSGSTLCPNPAFTCHAKLKNETQVVGRLGYALGHLLPYFKAGYASVDDHFNNTPATFAKNSDDHRQNGFVLGGGLDYAVTRNIILGVDYSHIDFEKHSFTSGNATFDIDGHADILLARLSFKFSPEPARYAPLK
jgi:outer membrane immunogenic protein